MKKKLPLPEHVLLAGVASAALAYFYFFLLIPQHWTLRDDYAFALNWGAPGADLNQILQNFLRNMFNTGRANVLDPISRYLEYRFLPVTPRVFHALLFVRAVVCLFFVWALLKCVGASAAARWLAVFLIVVNHAFKESLVTIAVSESLGIAFLMASLYFFYGKSVAERALSVACFACALLSKESFVVALVPFLMIGLTRYRAGKQLNVAVLAFTAVAAVFVVVVKSLPQLYTGGFGLTKIDLLNVAKSLVLPFSKSFAPLLLVIALVQGGRKFRLSGADRRTELAVWGAVLAVGFTVFLNAWGPFDSWFYLHTAVPFGWAIAIACLLDANQGRNFTSLSENRAVVASLGLLVAYGALSAMNGAKNYSDYFERATVVANLACEAKRKNPDVKVFSNCVEGSEQLRNYLLIDKKCANPPMIRFANYAQLRYPDAQGPALFLHSAQCDPIDLAPFKASSSVRLKPWTVHYRD